VHLGDNLVEARFLRRLNRFLAVVELDGRDTGVHVANSGRLRELFIPGVPVWLKPAHGAGRKTAYDLSLVESDGVMISADARLPNALVAEAVSDGVLEWADATPSITRESTFGESRFDLLLEGNGEKRYVEVKSVTLVENGVGLFPDSPTTRGAKHLNTLVEAVRAGHMAAVVFVVQRPDAAAFATNQPADPTLAEVFRSAVASGVDAYAYSCLVTRQEVRLDRQLPIVEFESIGSRRDPA
jgi:sugar fermentation stimulation protein A